MKNLLFDIKVMEEAHSGESEGPLMDGMVVPSDYLKSLPLDKKIEELTKYLNGLKEELKNLKSGDIGIAQSAEVEWLEGNISITESILQKYSEEAKSKNEKENGVGST